MKILLANKYHYIKGGADTVFFNTQKLLESHGHEVATFCTLNTKNIHSKFESYYTDNPEIRDLSLLEKIKSIPRFFVNSNAAQQIDRLIKDFRPDVVHIHNMFNGLSLAILPVIKKHNIPIVITLHDTRFICPSSYFNLHAKHCNHCLKLGGLNCGLYKCYQGNILYSWMCALEMGHKEYLFNYNKYIDKYIFVSERYKDFHKQRHSYFMEKGCVLYNFSQNLRDIIPNHHKGDYFLYYGRLTEEKGIRTLVEAMRQMPEQRLKVVGTGPLLEELRVSAPKNIEFLGFCSGEHLFNQVSNASFIIVPSEWEENNPLTIIEAYSYGKPVIGSKIGGIPEIINDHTGFLFEPSDIEGLRSTIQKASALSTESYKEMSTNARKFANLHFDPENHYKQLMYIYQQAIRKYENS